MSKQTEAARKYTEACGKRDVLERAKADRLAITVSSASFNRMSSLHPISDMIERALAAYVPQILNALDKQIAEEIALTWQALESARKEEEQTGLRVIK